MPLPRCGHLRHRQHRKPGLDQHGGVSRLRHGGSDPPVPDHPRPGADLHPPAASPGVDHGAPLHRPGHRLPRRHLRPAGDVPLAPRGRPLRPLDRLHGHGPLLHGCSHLPDGLLRQRGRRSGVQAAQQRGGGLLLRPLRPLHLLHHRGAAVCREGVPAWLTPLLRKQPR